VKVKLNSSHVLLVQIVTEQVSLSSRPLQSCCFSSFSPPGVYLHGRYTNLPAQLIAPLHTNLKEDLQWIISQASTLPSSSSFAHIQYLLMVTPCSNDSSQQIKKGSCRNMTGSSSVLLANFEDDIFLGHSACTIQIQFTKSPSCCCVILLPLTQIDRCLEEIRQLIPS
jgi:hypothetical protein